MFTKISPLLILSSIPVLLITLRAEDTAQALTGAQIIDKYVDTQEVSSELDFIRMSIVSPGPTILERRFLAVYKKNPDGGRSYLIRIIRPPDIEGVTLLSLQDANKDIDQYLYLPDVGEARKLRGKGQFGAFLGSDFTFQDLLRETPSNFTHERQQDAFVNGVDCYNVRAQPGSGQKDNPYRYRNLFIDKEGFELQKIEFYGQGNELVKTFSAFDYQSQKIKGKTTRPRRAVMENKSKNSVTIFTVIAGRIDEEISDELFTPNKIVDWTVEEVDEFIYNYGFVVWDQD